LRTLKTFRICNHVIKTYAKKFKVAIASYSIQHDHIHLLIRTNRKSQYQSFFRVVSGQIAQRVTDTFHCEKFKENFWMYRPFSRIVRDRKSYLITKAYIKLNELEVLGVIPYQKSRLKYTTPETWKLLGINPKLIKWNFDYSKQIGNICSTKKRDRYRNLMKVGWPKLQ
jgi:REP element-mobilizing transposase RayT